VSKGLRLKSFQPGEEYVYLTYSMKNDKREESRVLLENYRVLLQKALDYLWERAKVERKEVYKELRDELEKVNLLASHYVDNAINSAYSILRSWKRRAEKGQASLRKPRLRKVGSESVRITVRPYEYITFTWSHTWFSQRVKGLELGEPIVKVSKQAMFRDANNILSKKISKTIGRSIHPVLKYKAPLYSSFVKKVNPRLASKPCPRCGWVSRKAGRTFRCKKCGLTLDRQLNASLNIYLKMFPRISNTPRVLMGLPC
jgi:transposase